MRAFLATLLLLFVALVTVNSADVTLDWTFGFSGASPQTVNVGDTVTFAFSGFHNVWVLPDVTAFDACDFAASGAAEVAPSASGGQHVQTMDTEGTFYFGCQISSHCSSGNLKVEVIVQAQSTGGTPTLPPSATMLPTIVIAGGPTIPPTSTGAPTVPPVAATDGPTASPTITSAPTVTAAPTAFVPVATMMMNTMKMMSMKMMSSMMMMMK